MALQLVCSVWMSAWPAVLQAIVVKPSLGGVFFQHAGHGMWLVCGVVCGVWSPNNPCPLNSGWGPECLMEGHTSNPVQYLSVGRVSHDTLLNKNSLRLCYYGLQNSWPRACAKGLPAPQTCTCMAEMADMHPTLPANAFSIWLPLILGTKGLFLPEFLYSGTKNVCFLFIVYC